MPKNAEGFDRVFNLVGGGGLYQWLLLGILAIQVRELGTWNALYFPVSILVRCAVNLRPIL
jgi:hypothetical protein